MILNTFQINPKLLAQKAIIFTILFLTSSISIFAGPKSPEFIRTKDWKVHKLASGNMVFTAKAVFYNPNKAKAKLKMVNLDVFANDKFIGTVTQTDKTKIKGESSFDIPLKLEFNLKDSGIDILGSLLNLMTNNKFLVDLKGYIKLNVFCMPFKIAIDEKQEFSAKDFLN